MPGDSLDAVEFFMILERDFHVDPSDSEAERIDLSITVGAIYRLIARTDRRPAPNDPTWRRLVSMVSQFMDVPADGIGWDTQPFLPT